MLIDITIAYHSLIFLGLGTGYEKFVVKRLMRDMGLILVHFVLNMMFIRDVRPEGMYGWERTRR